MRNIYLSFLGIGSFNPLTQRSEYRPAIYEINGIKSHETRFVQVAEMALLKSLYDVKFDLILIAATQRSFDAHFENLKAQMAPFGAVPDHLILDEDMTSKGQWKWFESLLPYIEPGDQLTIDLTHGFRAIPIVFSAAIHFLQKSRDISLKAVYYGVWELEKDRGYAPIIDMKDFYLINEWADAVSRLVEDADARKMAAAAKKTAEFQAGELNDPNVIRVFDDLTNAIRNVDVNHVAEKANHAIRLIREKQTTASETGRMLLGLVIDKFVSLTTQVPPTGRYDKDYFQVQIEIIRLLVEHRLFMQAYTVMREFIASLAMIHFEKEGMNNDKRKTRRPRYGEIFFQMFQYIEPEWTFGDRDDQRIKMMPFYEQLKDKGIEPVLRSFANRLANYRNGFDHAWTSKSGAEAGIIEFGDECFSKLENVLGLLTSKGFFR